MNPLEPMSCQGYILLLNNFCVFALNTNDIQLLDIVIKVNNTSADDFIEQCSCESEGVVRTSLQNLILIVIFGVRWKAFFLLAIINRNINFVN